jgi:hypothetical protein
MKAAARLLALLLAASFLSAGALAQRERFNGRPRPNSAMSQDERQRMREDMREVYRERSLERGARPERPRQLSPEEREKLRRDVQNANKDLRR